SSSFHHSLPPLYTHSLSLHDALPIFAELYSPRYCTGDTCHCYSYFGSGGARVFRTWCTSSYTGVGENACGFQGLYPICTMDNDLDRKSTRLNSSHVSISYAVFCLKKKKT